MVAFISSPIDTLLQPATRARAPGRTCTAVPTLPCKPNSRCDLRETKLAPNTRWGSRSRDPIGYGGGKETLYSYCDSQPTTRVDPEGKAGCTVRLACTTLGLVAEHCGIETSTDGGRTWHRWHVRSPGAGIFTADTCDVRDGRITTPIGTWPWRDEMEWIDPTGQLCGCLDREAGRLRHAG